VFLGAQGAFLLGVGDVGSDDLEDVPSESGQLDRPEVAGLGDQVRLRLGA
jgi:hypothetical protein